MTCLDCGEREAIAGDDLCPECLADFWVRNPGEYESMLDVFPHVAAEPGFRDAVEIFKKRSLHEPA
jgi:hypothetical protein